jgi:O-antigen/teichoic acid export membrane protein
VRVGIAALLGVLLVPEFGLSGAAVSFTAAEFCLFAALVREAAGRVGLMVLRPLGWALLACVPMAVVLSLWPMSLPAGILLGALSFGFCAGVILRRGTHACGLA